MNRRDFLRCAVLAAGGATRALAAQAPADTWRVFEVTTRVEVLTPSGTTRVWLPIPLADPAYQKTLGNTFQVEGGSASLTEDRGLAPGVVAAEWRAGVAPVLALTSRVATRDRFVDLARPPDRSAATPASLSRFLQPTRLLPTGGIVKATAAEITHSARSDVEKARAIYEWIVDHTFRDPKTRGCGVGDIRFMLESKDLGGKCADLNALYVGLARAAGLPARDVYGLRVAKSERGFRSLGVATAIVTKAQHCRAEVYLAGYGWVPVDPADVRKVVLEEPPDNLSMDHEAVRRARERLFGSWEMNWIAYNCAHDVVLPESTRGALGFFMYPQCETADGRLDSLDADRFKYEITAREVA